MTEKFVIRFSPKDVDRPITAVSISAFEKYGENISYAALGLSEELTVKLSVLSDRVRDIPADAMGKIMRASEQLEIYNYAKQVSKELSSELGESFDVISTLEKIHPDHKNKYAECSIRPLPPKGYPLLDSFLYDAIFIPDGVEPPPYDIIKNPDLQVYVEGFGIKHGDIALAAVQNDKIVGMAWARIMNDYGHIDNETPSIAISVKKNYRGCGIGMQLMTNLLIMLCSMGFKRASLAVQRENHAAVKLYVKLGFRVLCIKGEEYIMTFDLTKIRQ